MFQNDQFEILNKDRVIAGFKIVRGELGSVRAVLTENIDLPPWIEDITGWLEGRKAPKHRKYIDRLLSEIGCRDIDGFVRVTHGLSLNDTLWVRESGSLLSWNQVSLYKNPFDDTIAHIAFEGGLYGKKFTSTSPEFVTDGAFAKCWLREDDGIYLIKRGSEGGRNAGLEPYSEMYASQIAPHICKMTIPYKVILFRGKIASKCPLFTDEQNGFLPMYRLIDQKAQPEDLLRKFSEFGDEDAFRRMVVFDAVVLNTDRHAGNYGVTFDTDTYEIKGMSPIFDCNQALLPYAQKDDFSADKITKYLSERPVRIGNDFNEIAHALLTPDIKSDLKNLRGFTFNRNTDHALSEWRLSRLENIVNMQINNILHDVRLYMPEQKWKDEPIFCDDLKLPDLQPVDEGKIKEALQNGEKRPMRKQKQEHDEH